MIKLYGKVKLKTGETAYIVEILKQGFSYVADIERDGETETDFISHSDIAVIY